MQLRLYELSVCLCADVPYFKRCAVHTQIFTKNTSAQFCNWHTSVRALSVDQTGPNACFLRDVKVGYRTEHHFNECGAWNNCVEIAGICWLSALCEVKFFGRWMWRFCCKLCSLQDGTDHSVKMYLVVSCRVVSCRGVRKVCSSLLDRKEHRLIFLRGWLILTFALLKICALKKTRRWRLFVTQNRKQACNCTQDTVGFLCLWFRAS